MNGRVEIIGRDWTGLAVTCQSALLSSSFSPPTHTRTVTSTHEDTLRKEASYKDGNVRWYQDNDLKPEIYQDFQKEPYKRREGTYAHFVQINRELSIVDAYN